MRGTKVILGTVLLLAACGGAKPSTPGPAPSATPSPQAPVVVPIEGETGPDGYSAQVVVVSRQAEVDAGGWLRLDGRLANRGTEGATAVGLRVRFYDSLGLLLDTREAIVTPSDLAPAQEATFALVYPPAQAPSHLVTLQPRWIAATPAPR
ncbi:MAG TPA: hypothetical protein V6D00_07780 [Pantanalinema sp.]